MSIRFYKYQGAGNDFVMVDNRQQLLPHYDPSRYARWCDRRFGIGADGLILINPPTQSHCDFDMLYYNADGYLGSMCGNGGRCAVAFAHYLGIIGKQTHFMAADGEHQAYLNADNTVSLSMRTVREVLDWNNGDYVLDTGSPHYVRFVNTITGMDINAEGRAIRHLPAFADKGINVNFVAINEQHHTFDIATFERGVEAETLACGTGVVAAAIAAYRKGLLSTNKPSVQATLNAKGGILQVNFKVSNLGNQMLFDQIELIGKAEQVFEGLIQ